MYNANGLFYIGKGTGTRIYNKTKRSKAFLKQAAIDGYYYNRLADNLLEEDAYELEHLAIELAGLGNLVNMVPGGIGGVGAGRNMEGPANPRYGVKVSDKTKARISASHIGKKASGETRKKMSKSRCFRYKIDGLLFDSGILAAKYFNVSPSTISRWTKINYKQAKIIDKFYGSKNRGKRSNSGVCD